MIALTVWSKATMGKLLWNVCIKKRKTLDTMDSYVLFKKG